MAKQLFEFGNLSVKLINVEAERCNCNKKKAVKSETNPPPKPLLIASPEEEGEYPVVVFLHGYLLYNSFYSQLFEHLASHGFIVIAPQLYIISGPDTTDEIKSVESLLNWLKTQTQNQNQNLASILPSNVKMNLSQISLAGHSRGGKVSFALAKSNFANSSLKISSLIAIDPVDGMDINKQTPPKILNYIPDSLGIEIPVLVIGSGLGDKKRNPLFPPAAPKGVSHEQFFTEVYAPSKYYFVAENYGHVDMLDDDTRGFRGKLSYLVCKNGAERKPMRLFVGGVITAFLKRFFGGENERMYLSGIKDDVSVCPVEISNICYVE
ncbi:hypothetical protein LUZ60_005592 [Juncus effusus]|nr:hypothetical protein LUZ60_005592 [Juncus effusus]